MIKIGIIGCDSTHTENYAAILNRDIAGSDMRATKLWGEAPDQATAKAAETGIPDVVDTPDEAMEGVDAVMVLNRYGDKHFAPAMQALDRQLPLFVDKPMCDNPFEAVTITRTALERGVPFMSASAVRYDRKVQELLASLPESEPIRSLTFTVPNGWRLYGVHAVEVMHAVFGRGATDVQAIRDEGSDIVVIRWPNKQVGVATQFRDAWMGMGWVTTSASGWAHGELHWDDTVDGIPRIYVELTRKFHDMLVGGPPPINADEMVDIIRVCAAAEVSASEQRRVSLTEMPSL